MKEQGDIQHGPSVLTGKRRGKTNKRKIISCVWGGVSKNLTKSLN